MFALICKPTVISNHQLHIRYVEPAKCKLIQYQCPSKLDDPCIFEIMEAPDPKKKIHEPT
jgi:hypothetical protein